MTLDELKVGFFYSNGAYGRTWGVRQLTEIAVDTETGDTWTRRNPSGTFASGGDIEAFPQELP